MYLKKIIASGFKSFADRVTINLEKNHITGIVGPNGSGKSNTIDAVRWVMGEQNAKMLRGDKATDIIFNGSEKRKPHGMAEVTLIFDNHEASPFCPPEFRHEQEISLTRRIYADGEREYFINKKPCRLKDLLDFFAYTGLGGKSYSMIQQGQVDRILQAKPEELREIIEEAAGTLVFKKRKAEAQKKLENTKLNLSRIDDILKELDRQKKALKDQVEKATTYKTKSEELKLKELALFAHNFRFFREKLESLKKAIDTGNFSEIEFQNNITSFEGQLLGVQEDLASADPEVHALSEEITVIREKAASSEAQLASALLLLGGGDQRLAELNHELGEEEVVFAEANQRFAAVEQAMEKAVEEETRFNHYIENFDQIVSENEEKFKTYSSKIHELDQELRNLDRLMVGNTLKLETTERDLNQSEANILGFSGKISSADNELSQLKIVLDGANIKVANRKRTLDDIAGKKAETQDLVQKKIQDLSHLNKSKDQTQNQLMTVKSRIEVLRALSEEQSGKVDAIRSAMGELGNKAGLLSDHLSFTDKAKALTPSCLRSLEKFLERAYVLDHDSLNTLRDSCQKQDTPSFAVALVDSDENSATTRVWAQQQGFEPASIYVKSETDDLNGLLSRMILASGLPEDLSEIPKGAILFTHDGMIWTGSADVIVGSPENKAGLLGRKAEIQKLEKDLEHLEKELLTAATKIQEIETDAQNDQILLKEVDQKLQVANHEWMAAMSELENTRRNAESRKEFSTQVREDYSILEDGIRKLKSEKMRLLEESSNLDSQKSKTQTEKEQLQIDMSGMEDERNEIQRQYGQKQMDLATAKARASSMRENFEQFKSQIDSIVIKIERRKEAIDRLTKDMAEAHTRKETLEKDIESFILRREDLEDKLLSKREANSGLVEQIRTLESRIKEQRTLLHKVQKELGEKNIELERVSLGVASTMEQAKERYLIEIADYNEELPEGFHQEKYTKDVQKIRSYLDTMGPINMMAIEEYETISSRESFISKQKDEVEASASLLESAIDEIEENSEEKFLAAFHNLNREFQELFPILFPGGDGHLLLTNEQKALDGGIEIMVRLPGKKRQPMRLFSGGEKALTAIALIFALLKSKPTPFCFLDEVDAPLDETNVGRYNRVLEALSERFQFIVITHNRRTMEVLDTLYGVTMQEPGVSKVVGVDMSKDIPAHLQKAFKETSAEG
ncbi:MAG: chromosome segregation protein SMC [Pseudomonadota bacterium]